MEQNTGWIIAGLALAWSVINTVYTWYSSSQAITKTEIDALMKDASATTNRLTALEGDVRALPSSSSFHQLELSVTELRGGMATLAAEFKPTAKSVARIEEWLMTARKER